MCFLEKRRIFFQKEQAKIECSIFFMYLCTLKKYTPYPMPSSSIKTGSQLLEITHPLVMGIINVTPDSFAVHCKDCSEMEIADTAEKMLEEGADILDVGGYSTRPNADFVDVETEWNRVHLALQTIRKRWEMVPVSVDTWRAEIAQRVTDHFENILINDVSGGEWDKEMYEIIARARVPYILTHTLWQSPQQGLRQQRESDILAEVLGFLQNRLNRLHQMGVSDVIIDPGFGLGKTLEENYKLLQHLDLYRVLECPLLAGLSRKSMFYKPLNITPSEALNATTAAHILALERGAQILRVHDVKEAKQTIRIFEMTHQQA